METVGERVRQEREAQGIDRKRLSKLTKIGYSTLAELERGGMKTSTKLHVIADALGVSISWLETGKGEKIPAGRKFPVAASSADTATQIVNLLSSIPPGVRPVAGKLLESLASTPDDPALQKLLRDVINSGGQK